MKYSMTCTCGHEMVVDAESKEEAASKLKEMMTQEELDKHWVEKHSDDTNPKPTLEQSWGMIDQSVHEVTAAPAV